MEIGLPRMEIGLPRMEIDLPKMEIHLTQHTRTCDFFSREPNSESPRRGAKHFFDTGAKHFFPFLAAIELKLGTTVTHLP